MKQLILHPTDTCQWHALVNEAQASTQLILNESTESYLVFLLMRFSHKTELMESVIALDYLSSKNLLGSRQIETLRDVGDKSLLFCGLFPGIATIRHVNLDYFTDLGQAAYFNAAELPNEMADLYLELSSQFKILQQILQAMRTDAHSNGIYLIKSNSPLQ